MNSKLLFTPGPLTTSLTIKQAMLRDVGSRDDEFIAMVRSIRARLLRLAGASQAQGFEAILMQGSGTFAIESVISSVLPPTGRLLIDAAVRRVARSYEYRGLLEKVTSLDAACGGSVVNEVKFEYNEFSQLAKDWQEHGGTVGFIQSQMPVWLRHRRREHPAPHQPHLPKRTHAGLRLRRVRRRERVPLSADPPEQPRADERLDVNIRPTAFKGDIHLSEEEVEGPSPLVELGRATLLRSRDPDDPHLTPPSEGAEREKDVGSAGASPYRAGWPPLLRGRGKRRSGNITTFSLRAGSAHFRLVNPGCRRQDAVRGPMTTSASSPPSAELCRRAFLSRGAAGLGTLALGALLNPRLLAGTAPEARWRGVVQPRHLAARCKRVIFLYQAGGPSHLETLDFKPRLVEMHGKPMPESFTKGQQIAQLQGKELKCFGPQHEFRKFGQSGQEMCALFPHLGHVADDLCIVRSMFTEQINHDPAHTFMNTGSIIAGRPSMGSWLLYGLGAETEDLPGYVVLVSQGRGGQMQPIAARQWHSGFLPSKFQGVKFQSQGDPVHYIRNPPGVSFEGQREIVDVVNGLNRLEHDAVRDPEILTRINQYEMAFRMQTSVPGLMDVSDEPRHILELYGAKPGDGSFASNCLLARRLAERGVRFIQLYHRDWDHHDDVKKDIPYKAEEVDRPSAALIHDLRQRGMLEDTLVVWGGEFGRTPMAQGKGRDHHIKGFSLWLAGGGIRGGVTYGATDELGYAAVENPVSVHDLHATLLHLFGIEHTRLTYRFQGRDFRLTDIAGEIVRPILA